MDSTDAIRISAMFWNTLKSSYWNFRCESLPLYIICWWDLGYIDCFYEWKKILLLVLIWIKWCDEWLRTLIIWLVGWLCFCGLSTAIGYSMPNPVHSYIINVYYFDLVWFVGFLWHINLCRLFNAKWIFM